MHCHSHDVANQIKVYIYSCNKHVISVKVYVRPGRLPLTGMGEECSFNRPLGDKFTTTDAVQPVPILSIYSASSMRQCHQFPNHLWRLSSDHRLLLLLDI